jgi:Fic family protein
VHPLIIIAVFIVSFLAIHPFQDGNGRLSRVLTTLLLLRSGYAYVPYSSLESVVEQTKERYYIALRQTQRTIRAAKPDWQPWLVYFLGVLTEQKLGLEKKIARERILLGDLPELSVQILELCRERGHVTISDIVKASGASRNTIKDHVTALVDKAHLVRHGAGRGTWYALS